MDEFREVVSVWIPKIVGITESCSKDKSEGDTHLQGYSQHRDDRGRGVILYCIVLIALSRCNRVFTRRLRLCHSHTVRHHEVRKGER